MYILKIWKKSWEPFGSYLLNSTANSAQFEWKWAGLAVLFSRYLPNGTHDFFQNFRICFFKDFIKNPQTTIALTFLTHIISGIDGVQNISYLPHQPKFLGNIEKAMWVFNCLGHTIYIRNNMGQKCEGNCGLWVLNEILKKTYPENLKKIVGAVWELPAK